MNKFKIFGSILFLLMISVFSLCGSEISNRIVRVGFGRMNGYHNIGKDGNRTGFGYDYLQLLSSRAGWNCEYVGYDKSWEQLLTMLRNGEIDLLSNVSYSKEREEVFDFSNIPIDDSFTQILIREQDMRFTPEDVSTWEGMIVGLVGNKPQNAIFKDFVEKYNIKYSSVEYVSEDDCLRDLQSGKIDAIISQSFSKKKGTWLLKRLAPIPVYFAVKKGNKKLLDELNVAHSILIRDKPNLASKLLQRHYSTEGDMFLSKEEIRFIKESQEAKRSFDVLIDPGRYPYIFSEKDGEYKGIQTDMINKILNNTRLSFNFLTCKDHDDYLRQMKEGKYDLIVDVLHSFSFAEKNELYLSDIYFSTPISFVYNKDGSKNNGKFGVVKDSFIAMILSDSGVDMDNARFYSSTKEMVKAVASGEIFGAYMFTRTCNALVSGRLAAVLGIRFCHGLQASFSFGVKRTLPPELISIIDYSILMLSDDEINGFINYVKFGETLPFSLADWISSHPLEFVAVCIAVIFIVVLIFMGILDDKREHYRHARILEKMPITFFVCDREGFLLYSNAPKIGGRSKVHIEELVETEAAFRSVKATIDEAFKYGHSTLSFDFNGSRRTATVKRLPFSDFNEDAVIWISQDTTELQNEREKAIAQGERLSATNRNLLLVAEMARLKLFSFNHKTLEVEAITPFTDEMPIRNGKLIPAVEWTSEDEAADFREFIKSVYEGRADKPYHQHRLTRNGVTFHNRCYLRRISDKSDILIAGIQDVTQSVETKASLDRMQVMWKTVVNSMPAFFYAKDINDNFRYVMANPDFCAFHGETIDSIIGKTLFEVNKNTMSASEIVAHDKSFAASGDRVNRRVVTVKGNNGEEYIFHSSKSVCLGPSGRNLLVGVVINITESAKKDALLQKEREMWLNIVNSLPISLYGVDAEDDCKFMLVNKDLATIFKTRPEDMIGKSYRDFNDDKKTLEIFYSNAKSVLKANRRLEFVDEANMPGGYQATYKTFLAPIKTADDKQMIVGASFDITEEVKLDNNLKKSNERLLQYAKQDLFQKQSLAELLTTRDLESSIVNIGGMLQKCLPEAFIGFAQYYDSSDGEGSYLKPEFLWGKEGGFNPMLPIPESSVPALFKELKNGRTLSLQRSFYDNTPKDLWEGWQSELYEYFIRFGFNEIILIPVEHEGKFWGILASEHYNAQVSFGEAGLRVLASAASMIELVLGRESIRGGLERSEQEKRKLLDMLPLPVCVVTSDFRIIHTSKSFDVIFGKSDGAASELCRNRICENENCSEDECPLKKTYLANGPQEFWKELKGRKYLVKTLPIYEKHSKISRIIIIFIDMTDVSKRQELLRKAVKKAREAEQAKSVFIATISHEIRTPLNAVIGFSELMKDPNLSSETRNNYLSDISTAGNALLSLINDILDLSKLESGQMTFTKTETSFHDLVHEVAVLFKARLAEKGLAFNANLPVMPGVMVDKQRMRQILFNLVGNAVKFTQKGSITIDASFDFDTESTGTLIFSVIDTGSGIKNEDQENIFKPFVQGTAIRGTKVASGGTGLGLSIIKRMLEQMGGKIYLESTFGEGSKFTVVIKDLEFVIGIEDDEETESTNLLSKKNETEKSILLVDDIPVNLKVVKAMCVKSGLKKIFMASSGKEALEILDREHIDLVLTDMWMPEMNGAELAKKIREDKRFENIRIFAVTADIEVQTTFPTKSFNGILLKPITFDKISRILVDNVAVKDLDGGGGR